jgi:hypothetical protein
MKVITICGSMRFDSEMKEIAKVLEIENNFCVLQCIYNEGNKPFDSETVKKLALAHYKKIDLSDAIYVVNIDGYIGESVKEEIQYALSKNLEIIYHQ